jgi:phosphatidylserine decarboxylase
MVFRDHRVLAHHGHTGDFICYGKEGAPVGDAIGIELIVRFPPLLRERLTVPDPVELDKGQEMGRFMLGSTVILLFPEGAMKWEDGYQAGSSTRLGEALGSLSP